MLRLEEHTHQPHHFHHNHLQMQNHVLGGGPWSFILWSGTNLASDSPCHWRYVSCPWKRQNRHEIYCWKTMKSRIQKICKCLKRLAERMSFYVTSKVYSCSVKRKDRCEGCPSGQKAFYGLWKTRLESHQQSPPIGYHTKHVLWKTAHMHPYWDMIAKDEMGCPAQITSQIYG